MSNSIRLLVSAALALTALAAVVGGAQATNSFSLSPGGGITVPSLGKLSFGSSTATIQCSVTLRGTFTRAGLIELSISTTVGRITEVRIDNPSCSGGEILEIGRLPWTISWEKLVGERGELGTLIALPIGKVKNIAGVNYKMGTFGRLIGCRYGGTSRGTVALTREATNETARRRLDFILGLIRADTTATLALIEGGGCPAEGFFAGTFSLTPTQKIIKRTP